MPEKRSVLSLFITVLHEVLEPHVHGAIIGLGVEPVFDFLLVFEFIEPVIEVIDFVGGGAWTPANLAETALAVAHNRAGLELLQDVSEVLDEVWDDLRYVRTF